jgi:hypothetical protein
MRIWPLLLLVAACGGKSTPPPAEPAPEPAAAEPVQPAEPVDPPAPEEAPLVYELPPPEPKGGDCDAVAARLAIIVGAMIDAQIAEMPPDQAAQARQNVQANPDDIAAQLATSCRDEGWSVELRDCILTAPTAPELEACEQYAPPEP